MSEPRIERDVRDTLESHVEAVAQGGDFDAAWRAVGRGRRVPWQRWALAASAVLVLGLAGQQAAVHAGFGRSAPTASEHWEEPYPLRFEVAAPVSGAAPHVLRFMADPADDEAFEAALSETPTDQVPALKLRRALAAARAGDYAAVATWGEASGLPGGLLVAAESKVVDLEREQALQILERIPGDGGIGVQARNYRALVGGNDRAKAFGEASALVALGSPLGCKLARELWESNPYRRRSFAKRVPSFARCDLPWFSAVVAYDGTTLPVYVTAPEGAVERLHVRCDPGWLVGEVADFVEGVAEVQVPYSACTMSLTGGTHGEVQFTGPPGVYFCYLRQGRLSCAPDGSRR